MSCGLIENEMSQLTEFSYKLMQTESDKFKSAVHMIQDYYYAIEDRLIPDAPE